MHVAAIQLTSSADRGGTRRPRTHPAAAGNGARLIVLPEMFNVLGDADVLRRRGTARRAESALGRRTGARHGIWLVAGSIMERVADESRLFNTSCLFDTNGEAHAVYRKIHLFDCDVAGASYHESATVMPGRDIVCTEADGVPLGLSICYDCASRSCFVFLPWTEHVCSHWPRRSRSAPAAIIGRCWSGAGHRESGVCHRGESGRIQHAEITLVWPLDDRRSLGRRAGASGGSRELHRRRDGFRGAGSHARPGAELGESPAGSVSLIRRIPRQIPSETSMRYLQSYRFVFRARIGSRTSRRRGLFNHSLDRSNRADRLLFRVDSSFGIAGDKCRVAGS